MLEVFDLHTSAGRLDRLRAVLATIPKSPRGVPLGALAEEFGYAKPGNLMRVLDTNPWGVVFDYWQEGGGAMVGVRADTYCLAIAVSTDYLRSLRAS